MHRLIHSLLIFLCVSSKAGAENFSFPLDSLLQVVHSFPNPQQQADSLNEWAWKYHENQAETALKLAKEALRISQEVHYLAGEGEAYKRMGQIQRVFGNTTEALIAFQSALDCKQRDGDQQGAAIILANMAKSLLDQEEFELAKRYYRQALEINLALGNLENAVQQYNGLGIAHEEKSHLDSATFYYRKAAGTAAEIEDPIPQKIGLARSWNNLGSLFNSSSRFDSAGYYWDKSRKVFASLGSDYEKEMLDPLNNLGLLTMEKGNPRHSLDSFFLPAFAMALNYDDSHLHHDLLKNLAQAYELAHQTDSALHYRKTYLTLHDTLFNQEKSDAIANAETRYQVKEKDATNALLRSEGQRKTIIILAVSVIALLVAGLAALFIYFQRRRLKAQQELSLRKEREDALRILELVQTQELRSLESLVEGQEKERSRMATELHDGLGSLLATVKLYFSQLGVASALQQAAFEKADHLLDEACQEVRRYSHDLAGLPIAQFGLLPAVRDLADSISGAGKLQVRVYAHQMDERLPLPVERSLYKVIQELLTNVIKHAQATEVTLQLSRHDDNLNLILEDNGKGMDLRQNAENAGLGLAQHPCPYRGFARRICARFQTRPRHHGPH